MTATNYRLILIPLNSGPKSEVCLIQQQGVIMNSTWYPANLILYYIQGQEIKHSTSAQYLGITSTIDKHLT